METQEIMNKHEKTLFWCEGYQTLEYVPQKVCGVCILGDMQTPTGCGPGQPTLTNSEEGEVPETIS